MKFVNLLLLGIVTLNFVSCTPTVEEWRRKKLKENKESISSPESIGTLPDGRQVSRFTYRNPDYNSRESDHFIYIVDGTRTVSTNSTETSGKTTTQKTTVVIGGIEYIPKLEDEKH